MRMKINRSGQLALAAAVSLVAAWFLAACQTLTVDFVFVTSAKAAGSNNYGEINVFEINSESGRMRQISTSPFPSGGRNPVAEAVSSDDGSLFVVNHDDNTIVQFIIGNDGKLYAYNTVNTPGIYPMAITTSSANLFVVDTYYPGALCSTANPCPGSISVYPLTAASGSTPVALGTAASNSAVSGQYWPLKLSSTSTDVIVPTGVNVLKSGSYVYVTAYDSTVSPNVGYVFAYSVGSSGVLTAVSGSPFSVGVRPSAIASDANSTYVYVTDYSSGNVRSFKVGSTGALTSVGTYTAGGEPSAIVVDPNYSYAYVANYLDSTVTAYSISSGVLTRLGSTTSGGGTYATGLQPVAIGIDPSTSHFLYTANFLDGNVSGFEISTTDGSLLESQNSPYATNAEPTAVAAVPHNGTGAGVK
jgi:6-phosphogluconolactonase (cycloisomerase 2 family)